MSHSNTTNKIKPMTKQELLKKLKDDRDIELILHPDIDDNTILRISKKIDYFCEYCKIYHNKELRALFSCKNLCKINRDNSMQQKRRELERMERKQNALSEIPDIHKTTDNELKYEYKWETWDGRSDSYIDITCKICRYEFRQSWRNHVGCKSKSPQGCNKCSTKRTADSQRMTKDELQTRSDEKFGLGKFEIIDDVINYDTKIRIFCKTCENIITQTPGNHLTSTYGCHNCSLSFKSKSKIDNHKNEFMEKDIYDFENYPNFKNIDFSEFIYTKSREKGKCICYICKNPFYASPNSLKSKKIGCGCQNNKTENIIKSFLIDELCLDVECEQKFDWCGNFRFDIHIPEKNVIIEVDGIQHFEEVEFFKSLTLQERQRRDKYKMKKAMDNGIRFIRISQEDVYYNKIDWKNDIKKCLSSETRLQFISKNNDIYDYLKTSE